MSVADEVGDDPIEYFLQDIAYQGKSERTQAAYERVLRQFEQCLAEGKNPRNASLTLDEATHRDCMAYIHTLRGSMADSTVATYASYLHRFYGYMTQIGAFESNPMTLVVEELDETIDTDPARREISIPEMRAFVDELGHPLHRSIVITLLKTGIRAGELCNLDQRDLNLVDDPRDGITVRPQLEGRPDSLYVPAEPARGSETNGERRKASNKRQRDTVIPVDSELRNTLVRWLAVRPDSVSEAKPLFTGTSDNWGRRITTDMVHHTVETHARAADWYHDGAGAADNVTPHYFRHFFTTHLRDRTGDRGVVKYLRGDVAQDVIDTYTHDWGTRVRDVYERHIYRLFR
jgi:integrase/recombinase XerC